MPVLCDFHSGVRARVVTTPRIFLRGGVLADREAIAALQAQLP